jgi:hypothetical protein
LHPSTSHPTRFPNSIAWLTTRLVSPPNSSSPPSFCNRFSHKRHLSNVSPLVLGQSSVAESRVSPQPCLNPNLKHPVAATFRCPTAHPAPMYFGSHKTPEGNAHPPSAPSSRAPKRKRHSGTEYTAWRKLSMDSPRWDRGWTCPSLVDPREHHKHHSTGHQSPGGRTNGALRRHPKNRPDGAALPCSSAPWRSMRGRLS